MNLGSTRVGSVLGIVGGLLLFAQSAAAQDIPSGPIAAERAVVLFESGDFELKERVPLRTVMPPFDGLPKADKSTAVSGTSCRTSRATFAIGA
jgi:hypothetical protein